MPSQSTATQSTSRNFAISERISIRIWVRRRSAPVQRTRHIAAQVVPQESGRNSLPVNDL
jgi:hypothetical protein